MNWVTVGGEKNDFIFLMKYQSMQGELGVKQASSRYRLVLIESGTGIVVLNGNQIYPLMTPSMICLNENETIELIQGSTIKARTIYFHPSVINHKFTFDFQSDDEGFTITDCQDKWSLRMLFDRQTTSCEGIYLEPATASLISSHFEAIQQVLHTQPKHWPCLARSYVLSSLYLIYQCKNSNYVTHSPEISRVEQEQINSLLYYLHVHYQEKIKLDDLAKMYQTNRTSLNEQFKKHTGQSVIAYLTNIRMEVASTLLHNTLLPVTEIMQQVGYKDGSHFYRHFVKHTGQSPTHYREKNCWLIATK
ncbi:AraC family transcriptional regulator [Bacillus alkalicellulosilyticus]|uniref:AraC family transcriptional regulator n=1 Tax=Alkalihalobacterium alkalicellulosilyticum TaxID=1912214 RepID=UPI0009965B27|nr:AraC family transcriptional regulator [Bacillus alkalicellulosilyticus]